METADTQTAARPTNFTFANLESDREFTQRRLDALLAANAETAREKSLFRSERERTAAALMINPLSVEKAFAYFGLLLGTFPPLAMFIRFFTDKGALRGEDFWILGVVAVINLISAVVGFFSGKLVGKIVAGLEKLTWTQMLPVLPFVGIFWGMLAGGAGGIIVFVIGAIFGAALGGAVGGIALPAFTIFHRLMKKGDRIDRRHFLPIAFGIAFVISAFILGL